MNNKSHIVILKVNNGESIEEAYKRKRLLIPIDEHFNGEVIVTFYKGNLSERFKKVETEQGTFID